MNLDTVNYLANLARLDIPENEKESIAKDLNNIIGFVDQIQKVEIDSTITKNDDKVNVFRDDIVLPLAAHYDLVEAAPEHKDGFVKVPKVIE